MTNFIGIYALFGSQQIIGTLSFLTKNRSVSDSLSDSVSVSDSDSDSDSDSNFDSKKKL
jgi:hypothetical protein